MTRSIQKIAGCTVLLIGVMFKPAISPGDTLRRGLGPEPDSLDIHQAQGLSAIHLLREIREGLLTFDAAGEPVAGVAASWSVSEDGLNWTFELRPDARWSNGDTVSADQFVDAWRKAVSPDSQARTASLLSMVEGAAQIMTGAQPPETLGIRADGHGRLEVRLARPTPWFTEILAHPVTYPLHESSGKDRGQGPVNGAFVIVNSTPHALIELKRNPLFHGAEQVGLDTIEYFPIEDPASELARFRTGELQVTESIPPGRFEWLKGNYPDALRVFPYLGSFWLGINVARAPFRDNPDLRHALSLAIDRDTLVRVILGAGELPAWGIVPPGLGAFEAAGGPGLNKQQREAEARRLFERAGFTRDNAPRIELRYNSSSQHRRMAVAVSAMWKQVLGVATTLINEEWKVFVNNRGQRVVTEVFRGGWIADYADPASFLDLFRSAEVLNWSGWSDPEYDRLMDESLAVKAQGRFDLLQRAEQRLLGDMPVIPLYYYVSRHLVAPEVTGFIDNVRDIHLSRYMGINTETQ